METIRKFFQSLDLKSLQSVGLLQENHIAIFITQEVDYTRLLMRPIWYIAGAPMKMLKWSPEFYPSIESPVVPVWIGLPGLPLHFFEKSALFCLASAFGAPLKVDEPTANLTRPTVARVCIEIDVSKPRNSRLWIGDDKDGFWQEVVFENPPLYCDFCKMLGHDVSVCSKKDPNLQTKKQKVHLDKEATLEGKKAAGATQKEQRNEKRSENRNEIWRKKDAQQSLHENNNEKEWTVVGGKHKPKSNPAVSVVPEVLETEKGNKKDNEKPTEKKGNRGGRVSVIVEKAVKPAVVDKTGEQQVVGTTGGRPIAQLPPLLNHHLSFAGIALTPFPAKRDVASSSRTSIISLASKMRSELEQPVSAGKNEEVFRQKSDLNLQPLTTDEIKLHPLDGTWLADNTKEGKSKISESLSQPFDQVNHLSQALDWSASPGLMEKNSAGTATNSIELLQCQTLFPLKELPSQCLTHEQKSQPSISNQIEIQPLIYQDKRKSEEKSSLLHPGNQLTCTAATEGNGGIKTNSNLVVVGDKSWPFVENQSKGQDLSITSNLLEYDKEAGLVGELVEAAEELTAFSENAAAHLPSCQGKKIRPLDHAIDFQPLDPPPTFPLISDGPHGLNKLKGLGELGFEFFKGPNLNHPSGLQDLNVNAKPFHPSGLQMPGFEIKMTAPEDGPSDLFSDGLGNYSGSLLGGIIAGQKIERAETVAGSKESGNPNGLAEKSGTLAGSSGKFHLGFSSAGGPLLLDDLYGPNQLSLSIQMEK